jgi:hypothetical protein
MTAPKPSAQARARVLWLARRGFDAKAIADFSQQSEAQVRQSFARELEQGKARPLKAKTLPQCAKCPTTLEARRLSREVERLVGMDRARVVQALAGGPVCLSDAEIETAISEVYAPSFREVLQVPRDMEAMT